MILKPVIKKCLNPLGTSIETFNLTKVGGFRFFPFLRSKNRCHFHSFRTLPHKNVSVNDNSSVRGRKSGNISEWTFDDRYVLSYNVFSDPECVLKNKMKDKIISIVKGA